MHTESQTSHFPDGDDTLLGRPAHHGGRQERCETALEDVGLRFETETEFDEESIEADNFGDASDSDSSLVCEHCGSESLTLIDEIDKPSWVDVFRPSNEACPDWYRASLDLDDRRFWDAAMGEGFSDWYAWYLKSGTESAREPTVSETLAALPESNGKAGMRQLQLF